MDAKKWHVEMELILEDINQFMRNEEPIEAAVQLGIAMAKNRYRLQYLERQEDKEY